MDATWLQKFKEFFSGPWGDAIQSVEAFSALIVLFFSGIFTWYKWFRSSGSKPEENPLNQLEDQTQQQWYFQDLRYECQYYSLEDLDEEHSGDHLSLQLSDIYCDQLVRMPETSSEVIRSEARPAPQEQSAIPLLEAISKLDNHRIVIRGIVGSGKSSFVNFLVNCIILSFQNTTPDIFPDAFSRRPVIRLLLRKLGANIKDAKTPRNFLAQAILDQIEDHIKSFAKSNREQFNSDSVHNFSKDYLKKIKTNGVILLDGLDEVASGDKRKAVLLAIREFVDDESTSENIHVIITSRPHAYDNSLADFIRLEIEPMQWPQVKQFIRHWYRQIAGKKLHHSDDPEYQNRATKLISQISDRPSLRIMTETPLLLTLLLALDAANYQLPRSRAELYDRAVKLLLQRWHINLLSYKESLEPEEQSTLSILVETAESTENLRKALCRLALESYEDASKTVTKNQSNNGNAIVFRQSQVLGHINKSYRQSMDAEAVQYFLQYRSNLLVAHGDEHLSFVHKSFHEFLAAEGFKYREQSKDSLHKLLEHSEQRNWWREVLLFWMNRKEIGELTDFIRQYISQDVQDFSDAEKQNHAGIILLCTQAAIEAEFESEILSTEETGLVKLFQAMQRKLLDLMKAENIPVELRAESGQLLGLLGDYRTGVGIIRDINHQPITVNTNSLSHAVPDIVWEKISAGEFQMGSADDDPDADDSEKPAHPVAVNEFYISRYPVTNGQYQCFIDAGGYDNERYWQYSNAALGWLKGQAADLSFLSDDDKAIWEPWISTDTQRQLPRYWENQRWTNPNHPVVGICWYEALAYCQWLKDCKPHFKIPIEHNDKVNFRLPREEEWEYAARGKQGLNYAWGNQADPQKGNYDETELNQTSSVGLFAPGIGFDDNTEIYDLSGNVWEWTQSRWGKSRKQPEFDYARWDQPSSQRNDLEPVEL